MAKKRTAKRVSTITATRIKPKTGASRNSLFAGLKSKGKKGGMAAAVGVLIQNDGKKQTRQCRLSHFNGGPLAADACGAFFKKSKNQEVAALFSALANPHRVAICKSLLSGAKGHTELRAICHLNAGPLYHHLRELRLAGYLGSPERDRYALSPRGRDMLLIALCVGAMMRGRSTNFE